MREEIKYIEALLSYKDYNRAWKKMRSLAQQLVAEGHNDELISLIRNYMFFLNKSGDPNQTSLFCNRLMKLCLDYNLDVADYVEQCRVLNIELEWHSEQYRQVVQELQSLSPDEALHVILAIFENLNQNVLGAVPNDLERIFYTFFAHRMETDYESGISALNSVLKLWVEGVRSGAFHGKFKELPYVPVTYQALREKLVPIIRSLNYLHWVCKEISLNPMKMSIDEQGVVFTYTDKTAYIRYKLPLIRDTVRMQNARRTLPKIAKKRFGWSIDDIDYDKIIRLKPTGDDFRLEITPDYFFEAFKRSIEDAYQSHLLILRDMYIENLHEINVRGFAAIELLLFYYCLKTVALLYFEATKHFINTHKKEARAPYLIVSRKDIGDHFIFLLSKVLKRTVNQEEIDKMIDIFAFGSDGLYDLYYKPIIVRGGYVAIVPSLFLMNNFHRTFLFHLNRLGANLSERGDTFEVVTREHFKNNNFKVHPNQLKYSYEYNGVRINGDIDLIAIKGEYLFLGQLKNRFEPLEPRDYEAVDTKIRKAAYQAEQAVLYVQRNPDDFCNKIGITRQELDSLKIQPFVLISCFYGSGQIMQEAIPIIDTSALEKFFEGSIKVHPGDGEPYIKEIRTPGDVLPDEFVQFLYKPYFLREDIYGLQLTFRHVYPIRDRNFVLKPESDWNDVLPFSFIAEAITYFEEKNLLP